MKYLALAAALCAASLPACAQSNSAGWSAGDASDSPPLVTPQPRQLVQQPIPWPVLAPYPRTAAPPLPQPMLPLSEEQETALRIKQLEQHNRLLMLQFQQRIFEDALRLPRH